MSQDRIVELRVRNLRSLADVRVQLNELTVGIGTNGSGKSSLVEACVLLKRVASDTFMSEIYESHGGAASLFRRGQTMLMLGVRIEGAGVPLEYEIELGLEFGALVIRKETLSIDNGKKASKFVALRRLGTSATVFDQNQAATENFEVESDRTTVAGFRGRSYRQEAVPRLASALNDIEVHAALMTHPKWLARTLRFDTPMRDAVLIQPAERLAVGGSNLANVYFALKNKDDTHWQTTMNYVRLGLGDDVAAINTQPDPSGGRIALTLKRHGVDQQEPASSLSEGMLTYLAFVGILRLAAPTSLLVFDEPETHLHPRLMNRLMDFADAISERTNVMIFSHADRLLDVVPDPANHVVLLDLDHERKTQILRPDASALEKWLNEYRTLSQIRNAGEQYSVFTESP